MKLTYQTILDAGSADNERLLLNATADCNLGNFLLALVKRVNDKSVSSNLEHPFWLNDASLKANDLVVVYTTRKDTGVKTINNPNGATTFFVFWNLEKTLNELTEYSFVLFDTTWKTFSIINNNSGNEGNPI